MVLNNIFLNEITDSVDITIYIRNFWVPYVNWSVVNIQLTIWRFHAVLMFVPWVSSTYGYQSKSLSITFGSKPFCAL